MTNKEALMHSDRIPALDGLRGFAALVVVVTHALLVSPALADAYAPGADHSAGRGWFVRSPLHLVWAGTEAVYVFFVLSGFVLALPFLGDRKPAWTSYYPQRLVRLYLPVWGSVLFAVALFLLVDRSPQAGASWWLNAHMSTFSWKAVVKDSTLLVPGAPPGAFNTALWSLTYEVIFSLFLPVYLFIAIRFRQRARLLFLSALTVVGLGVATGEPWMMYLPMFGLGVLLVVRSKDLAAYFARFSTRVWVWWCILTWALLTSRWWMPGPASLVTPVAALGAVMVVVVFLSCPGARAAGQSTVAHWLGKRSFSLYLVHEPIVVTLAFALPRANFVQVLAMALPSSLAACAMFYRYIEMPSHRLARSVGQRFVRRRAVTAP